MKCNNKEKKSMCIRESDVLGPLSCSIDCSSPSNVLTLRGYTSI